MRTHVYTAVRMRTQVYGCAQVRTGRWRSAGARRGPASGWTAAAGRPRRAWPSARPVTPLHRAPPLPCFLVGCFNSEGEGCQQNNGTLRDGSPCRTARI